MLACRGKRCVSTPRSRPSAPAMPTVGTGPVGPFSKRRKQMTKFGWDLPPGVTTSMLPGNTPAEQKEEAAIDKLYEILGPVLNALGGPESPHERLVDEAVVELYKQIEIAYSSGYADGVSDNQLAKDAEHDTLMNTAYLEELKLKERQHDEGMAQHHQSYRTAQDDNLENEK